MFGDGPRRRRFRRLARNGAAAIGRSSPTELAAVFGGIPIALVAVSLLPGSDGWRLSLAAESVFASRWTLWTAYASSFVHSGPGHLANNVGSYLLVMAALYPLAALAGWRRQLAETVLFLLVVVPFVSAWVTLATLGSWTDLPTAGFSDLNTAFLGTLLVVWFVALERLGGELDGVPRVDARWSGVAFALSLAVVFGTPGTVVYFPAVPTAAGASLTAAALGAAYLRSETGWPRPIDVAEDREFCIVYGAGVLSTGVVGSLLVVPVGMNVWAHLAGYVVGFLAPFVGFVLSR